MQELLVLLRNHLHSLLINTIQALEETGRTVCDVTNTGSWEHTIDQARQVWDQSRYVDIFLKLLEHVDGDIRAYPETTVEPVAAGLTDDALVQIIELAQKVGDADIERALHFVRAETNTRGRKDQAYAIA